MSRMSLSRCMLVGLGFLLVHVLVAGNSHAQPANDDCQNATPITDGIYVGTTVGSSVDGMSAGCPSGTGPDVWYLYTATCDGLLEVDTCTSHPFDTNLSIQYADCSGSEVACNEDACGPDYARYQSLVSAPVVNGDQYLIRVSGWGGDSGPFELHVSCHAVPSNDHCADAEELDLPTVVQGSTEWADYDPAADMSALGLPRAMHDWRCGRHMQDAWFNFESPGVWYGVVGTGTWMTASVGGEPEHGLVVFCDSCDQLICVAGVGAASASWCSRAGQVYKIWVLPENRYVPGEFELSVVDDGIPCYGAVDCVPVEVIDTFVIDNGDEDGWADTHETVSLAFTVANRSGIDVTGLVAHLTSDDPKVACMAEQVVYIGDLAAGETRLVSGAFTFRLSDADRAGAGMNENDDFTALLKVNFASDQFADLDPRRCSLSGVECDDHGDCLQTDVCANKRCWISGNECIEDRDCASNDTGDQCLGRCSESDATCWRYPWTELSEQCDETLDFCVDESQELRAELDLDASLGSDAQEYIEGFESGDLGSFTGLDMNLDAGLHGNLELSDGFRCQYNDPSRDGYARETHCWPGANAPHAEAYFWQVVDERSYSGLHSLYMGYELAPGMFTTPVGHLEAIRTSEPINLGWDRACSGADDPGCTNDMDCPPGEHCLIVSPELTFKHQVSLMNERWFNTGGHAALSMGVVQVQVVDAEGSPVTPWQTVEPKVNRYDSRPSPWFSECFFDPVDDGSTEDDLFDYFDAEPRMGSVGGRYLSVGDSFVDHASRQFLGPSSTCFPQRVFSSAGDTDEPFDPLNLNGPVRGPGLQGALGPGTWVEPVFNLDRYRGRRIRLRFLVSTGKTWLPVEFWPPDYYGDGPVEDGWWIDEVTITNTLQDPATVAVDTKDNSALATDTDSDCIPDCVDCAANDDQLWALPSEVLELRLFHTGGANGTTTLSWLGCATKGSTTVDHIVVAQEGASCAESNVGEVYSASDSTTPPPGVVRQFLIQAENGYGRGPLGTDSMHNPRTGCD